MLDRYSIKNLCKICINLVLSGNSAETNFHRNQITMFRKFYEKSFDSL